MYGTNPLEVAPLTWLSIHAQSYFESAGSRGRKPAGLVDPDGATEVQFIMIRTNRAPVWRRWRYAASASEPPSASGSRTPVSRGRFGSCGGSVSIVALVAEPAPTIPSAETSSAAAQATTQGETCGRRIRGHGSQGCRCPRLGAMPALVDVVVVSYRSRDLLRNCLSSLARYPPRAGARIWVVDNCSLDGTAEMVKADFPDVELVESERNLGFAAANNFAIRRGRARYVLALNPDTRVTAGALDHMVAVMDGNASIGIAGCRLELEDGTFDHAARRSFPTPLSALGHFSRLGRSDHAPAWLTDYRAPSVERGPVDAVNGAFMLFRRRALDEVGLFDEGYWMYMEDLDICYRFAQAGWVTWYEPDVTVVHIKAGTSGKARKPRLDYAFHYGMFRFYRKHYAASRSPILNFSVYAAIAVKLAISLARNALRRRAVARA
jgi:GT2 family glycosyltransferase